MNDLVSLSNDPNVIVALVASSLAGKGPYVIQIDKDIGADDHLGLVEPDRLANSSFAPDLRPIMDALVEVSANTAYNEFLACALRVLDHEPGDSYIELLLCGTAPIQSATVRHLHNIWHFMGSLSRLHSCVNQTATQKLSAAAALDFDCVLLSFSLAHLRRIFATQSKELAGWAGRSDLWEAALSDGDKARYGDEISGCVPLFKVILGRVVLLTSQLDNLSPWDPASPENDFLGWEKCRDDLRELGELTTYWMDDKASVSAWEVSLNGTLGFGAVRSRLKKITSLYTNISILRRYASSQSSRAANSELCRKTLRIRTLAPVHTPLNTPWPASPDVWAELRRKLFDDRGLSILGDPDASGGAHDLSLLPARPDQLVVHPELVLISHLHQQSLRGTGGGSEGPLWYNYVGIAGQACKPCSAWIRRFNRVHGGRNGFAIGGSNNEWVPGWAMPQLECGDNGDDDRRETLSERVVLAALTLYFSFMEDCGHWKRNLEDDEEVEMLEEELCDVIILGDY